MSTKPTATTDAEISIRLTMRSLPASHADGTPAPPDHRLRQALKALLRQFGFRVERVEELPTEEPRQP